MALNDLRGEKPLTYNMVLNLDNSQLNYVLAHEFYTPIPINVDSVESMMQAGTLLGKITNSYSWLMVIYAQVDAQVRLLKKDKDKKEEYTDLVGKRNTIEAYIEILKQSYAGLSREISTRQEALKEINMSKSVP